MEHHPTWIGDIFNRLFGWLALPLLEALAARRAGRVVLEYLHETRVQVDITFGTP